MKAFIAVAEAGQFALASERLGLSRAMASKLVMDLEAHLGVRLLNRTTRKVSLTEPGIVYLERCRDIIVAVVDAENEISNQATEPLGHLRVSAPMSFGVSHLARQIAAFKIRYPRVSIDLVLNDRLVDIVEEGYDLAIRIGRLTDSSLIARRIGASQNIVCASPIYLSSHGRPEVPAELSQHDCVLYSYASAGDTWTFSGPKGEQSVRVGGSVVCNNGDAICRMAIEGLGVVALPDFIVEHHLRSGVIQQILSDYPLPAVGIYAVYPSARHLPRKLRAFVNFLSRAFSQKRALPEFPLPP